MAISAPKDLTECRRFFAQPTIARQRQYEALRAYFFEQMPTTEAARRFGYSAAAFRVLCHNFRRGLLPHFFAAPLPGPQTQPTKSRAHEQVVALRKRNYSSYEISHALKDQGIPISATAVREILAKEGFAPLPRRLDEERPSLVRPTIEAVADVRNFVLAPGEFTTRVGGLFLFIADLVRLNTDTLAGGAKLPGSRMIPATHALRTSLALKLWSIERKSHVMALVADPGLALFAGLNVMPKKSFLSEYSSRITPQKVAALLAAWHTQSADEAFLEGSSINLDFHSVPFFGEDPQIQRHYLSKRSRRQPSILTFLAQDADSQVFCYSNADIRKGEEANEIFRFIKFWRRQRASRLGISSSIPNSPPMRVSLSWMRPISLSLLYAAEAKTCLPKSIGYPRRPGVKSLSTCPSASIKLRASSNRRFGSSITPTDSSSSRISAMISQPSSSPMMLTPRLAS